MSNEFKPVPTTVGGLLGGAGGYALAHLTDMDARGKALMSAAGAALGGGLGHLRGQAIDDSEVQAAELAEARDIMRRKNRRDRAVASAVAGGLGTGLTVGVTPWLAARHHSDYMKNVTKPYKEWGEKVRELVAADEASDLAAVLRRNGSSAGADLTAKGAPFRDWRNRVTAITRERLNKRYEDIASRILRDNPGLVTDADLTTPGVPYRVWNNRVKEKANELLSAHKKRLDDQIARNGGVIASGLHFPDKGTQAYKNMYRERLEEAKDLLKASKPSAKASYIPKVDSPEWRSEFYKLRRAVREELRGEMPLRTATYIPDPAELKRKGSAARILKARRLKIARAKLATLKPGIHKRSKLFGTLSARKKLYTALGLAGTLGLVGLADWATKDSSLS